MQDNFYYYYYYDFTKPFPPMFNSNAFITASMVTSRNCFTLNLGLVDYSA